jgi:hypothetical protein
MTKGTTKIAGYTFEDDEVVLDFMEYESCKFIKCRIVYYGHGPFKVARNEFAGCTWHLVGPAAAGLTLLRHLAGNTNMGGKDLVSKILGDLGRLSEIPESPQN